MCPKCSTIAEERKTGREDLMQAEKLLKEKKIETEKRTKEQNERCEKEIERLKDILRNEEINNQTDTTHLQNDLQIPIEKMADLGKRKIIKLPEFYGNYRSWPRFKLLFDETTRTEKLTNLENLTRLQTHLKGEALKSVSELILNPNNVDAILERLGRLYGNPISVFNALLKDLLAIKRVSLDNLASVIELSHALNNMLENMTMLNQKEYLMDQRLLTDLFSKLSPDLKNRWLGDFLKESGKIKNLTKFSKWLKSTEEIAITLVAMEGGQERSTKLNTHFSTNRKISKGCLICSRPHETTSCYKL